MPSNQRDSIIVKTMGLTFLLFNIASALLAYLSTYNAFFMDLPVTSFVFHSSLLTMKSVDLVVHVMASFHNRKLSIFFISANCYDSCPTDIPLTSQIL